MKALLNSESYDEISVRTIATSNKAGRNINPKHLVGWLVRKPQAFRNYKYQADLLANLQFKYIWEFLDRTMEEREACKIMCRLLHLAYKYDCIEDLADSVIDRFRAGDPHGIGQRWSGIIGLVRELARGRLCSKIYGTTGAWQLRRCPAGFSLP